MVEGIDILIRKECVKRFCHVKLKCLWVVICAFEGNDTLNDSQTPYEEALDALSSLIVNRRRCDKSGDRFELMFEYVKVLLKLNTLLLLVYLG